MTSKDGPMLRGEHVLLRPLLADDRLRFREILAEPEVARWWGTAGPDQAVEDLYDASGQVSLAIEANGALVGSIQFAEEDEPDYRHASVDVFLDTAHQGRGLGSDALRTLARYLFEVRGHHRLTIDPAIANERAIRAYRRVGFQPVGVMRAYERGRDGSWHDALLMDLLISELDPSVQRP